MKVSELTGAKLDYWVAEAQGMNACIYTLPVYNKEVCTIDGLENPFMPSTRWDHGGQIIEREGISLLRCLSPDPEHGHQPWIASDINDMNKQYGDTPLIAAMRCFVASKFGETVED